ncbi:MAG: hypothetical protein WC520_01670 [Candidatus Paceibacterota bacterium]
MSISLNITVFRDSVEGVSFSEFAEPDRGEPKEFFARIVSVSEKDTPEKAYAMNTSLLIYNLLLK